MADDERRAESEAMARALHDACCEFPWETCSATDHRDYWMKRGREALDRVRDARGSDAWIEVGDDGDTITAMSHEDSWQPQGRYYLARSPQDEDHEAGIDRERLTRWLALRLKVSAYSSAYLADDLIAYLSRVSPVSGTEPGTAKRVGRNDSVASIAEATLITLVPYLHWQGSARGVHNCDFEDCQVEPCPRLRRSLAEFASLKERSE